MHSCKGQPWKSSPVSQWAYCFVCSATWNQIAVSSFHQMKKLTSGIRVALHRNFLSPRLTQVRFWTFKKYEQLEQLKKKINQQPRHFLCPAFNILILSYWKPLCLPMHIEYLKGHTAQAYCWLSPTRENWDGNCWAYQDNCEMITYFDPSNFYFFTLTTACYTFTYKKIKSEEASCISYSFLLPYYLFFCLLWF